MRPTFGTVLAALVAAHDFGDHIVQTDHQAANKAEDWRAMGGHVGGYTVTQLAALRVVGVRLFSWRTLAGVAFSAATHAFIDRRWPVKWLLRHTGSPNFAMPLLTAGGELTIPTRFPEQSRYYRQLIAVTGNVPIHGPYLADQALHHACLFISARIIVGSRAG